MSKTALIIDTATPNLYVILARDGKIISSKVEKGSLKHSQTLTITVDQVLTEANADFCDIDCYACNIGTGSFTGIRIGVASVKAYLLASKNSNAVAYTSQEAYMRATNSNACLMDAGRELFYYQEQNSAPRLITQTEAEKLSKTAVIFENETDLTDGIVKVVFEKIAKNEYTADLSPIYLRKPQAQEDFEKKIVEAVKYTESDFADMENIENVCFGGEAWSAQSLRTINRDQSVNLGIYDGARLVAYGLVYCAADQADLATIGVLPEYRKKGYGGAILTALLAESKKRGVAQMALEVSKGNTAAIKMYTSFGFNVVGIRKNYYENSNFGSNDAYVMVLPL